MNGFYKKSVGLCLFLSLFTTIFADTEPTRGACKKIVHAAKVVTNNLCVKEDAQFNGDVSIDEELIVKGDATFQDVKVQDDLDLYDKLRFINGNKQVEVETEITAQNNPRVRFKGRVRIDDRTEFRDEIEVSNAAQFINDVMIGGNTQGKAATYSGGVAGSSLSAQDFILLDNCYITVDPETCALQGTRGNIQVSPEEFVTESNAASPLPIVRVHVPINRFDILRVNPGGRIIGEMIVSNRTPKYTFAKQTDFAVCNGEYCGTIGIELRGGNSTNKPKRSYNAETRFSNGQEERRTSILGYPIESDWILKGDWVDPTSGMRNRTALWIQKIIKDKTGDWAPEYKWAELIIEQENPTLTEYNGLIGVIEKIKRSKNRLDLNKDEGIIFEILRADEVNKPNIVAGEPDLSQPGGLEFARTNTVARLWSRKGLWGIDRDAILEAGIDFRIPEAINVYQFQYPAAKEKGNTPSILDDSQTFRRDFWIKRIIDMERDLAPFVTMTEGEAIANNLKGVFETYFDLNSLIDHYILREVFYSGDTLIEYGMYANDYNSVFQFLNWDFDQSAGHYNFSLDTEADVYDTRIFQGFTIEQKNKRGPMGLHSYPFWFDLVAKTPDLRILIAERWDVFKECIITEMSAPNYNVPTPPSNVIEAIDAWFDFNIALVQPAAERDNIKWGIRRYPPIQSQYLTLMGQANVDPVTNRLLFRDEWLVLTNYLRDWLKNRITFIDEQWHEITSVNMWESQLRKPPVNPLATYKEILTFDVSGTSHLLNNIVANYLNPNDGSGGIGGYTHVVKNLVLNGITNPVAYLFAWATALAADLKTSDPAIGVSGLWTGPLLENASQFNITTPAQPGGYTAVPLFAEWQNPLPNPDTGMIDQITIKIKIIKDLYEGSKPYFTDSLKENLYFLTFCGRKSQQDRITSLALKNAITIAIAYNTPIMAIATGDPSLQEDNAIAGVANLAFSKNLQREGGFLTLWTANVLEQWGLQDETEIIDGHEYSVFTMYATRMNLMPGPAVNQGFTYPTPEEITNFFDNGNFAAGEEYFLTTALLNISNIFGNGFALSGGLGFIVGPTNSNDITIPI